MVPKHQSLTVVQRRIQKRFSVWHGFQIETHACNQLYTFKMNYDILNSVKTFSFQISEI